MTVDLRSLVGIGAKLDTSFPAFFRHRRIGEKVLITNYEGNWLLLSDEEFGRFARGDVPTGTPLHTLLRDANFIRAEYDVQKAITRVRARKSFLHLGPNLHILVVTLRCNETCVYCHASRANMEAVHTDMSKETAERSIDFILRSTSPSVTIEFQGGEPLVNFEVVKHTIAYAIQKNESIGKQLEFTMVSNLSLMDEEKLGFLLQHKVQICTSIDGPEHLHDKQRKLPGFSSHKAATKWIARINEAYAEMGLDPTLYHVEALLTTTKETLPRWKEVVDTYVGLGCKALFLRPIDPFGFVEKTGARIEYPRSEYMEFYQQATDYMLELNKQGVQILERYAAIFLTKILAGEDPNFLDIRSPAARASASLPITTTARSSPATRGECSTRPVTTPSSSATCAPAATARSPATRRCARWSSPRNATASRTASTAPTTRIVVWRQCTATRRSAASGARCASARSAPYTRASRTICSASSLRRTRRR